MHYRESTRHHNQGKTATLTEAIDLLTTIADGDFDNTTPISENGTAFEIQLSKTDWGGEQTLRLAQASFRTILHYFKDFYKKELEGTHTPHVVERVTAIMALVTRAAKRFENFSRMHRHCLPHFLDTRVYSYFNHFVQLDFSHELEMTTNY